MTHNLNEISLTLVDQQILNSYCGLIQGLSDYLGDGYEIVLHSLASLENSVIAIVHGEYTGRTVGAPITNRALEMLKYFRETGESYNTYFSTNQNGEPLKSTTIAIRGESNRIIGLLCMNFYLNTKFVDILNGFLSNEKSIAATPQDNSEIFASNVDDMIYYTLDSVRKEVYSDPNISASNKNKAIICSLYDKGIFKIKDSVPKIADRLGISKNTVYLHLRNYTEGDKKNE